MIQFRTKEESNKAQEESFLALSPTQRFYSFIDLIQKVKRFPTKSEPKNNDNFIIEIKLADE